MSKNTYYFSHDTNANRDLKSRALIKDYGAEGYGIYWMLIETLAEQEGYKLEKFPKLYEGLAEIFGVSLEQCSSIVEAMLKQYLLLVEDDKYIWSLSLLRRMGEMEAKRQKRVNAGRLGGLKSRSELSNAQAMPDQCSSNTQAKSSKERKVKESKVKNNYAAEGGSVTLTDVEYQRLIAKFGEKGLQDRIKDLELWKLSKGKTTKSDYATILSWDRLDKKRNPQPAIPEYRTE